MNRLPRLAGLFLVLLSSLLPAVLKASMIDIEYWPGSRIDKQIVTARTASGAEIQVEGVFLLPRFDQQDYRIVAYDIELDMLAFGFGWTPDSYKLCTTSVSVGFGNRDSTLIKPVGNNTTYGFKRGSIFSYQRPTLPIDMVQKGQGRIYGTDPLEVSFWLIAGGAGSRGGGTGAVQWGSPKVKIKLEKLNPAASDNPTISPAPQQGNSFSFFQSATAADRPQPSLFDESVNLPAEFTRQLPIKWTIQKPRIFEGTLYAFSDYRYRVMRSSDFGEREEIHVFNGADQEHSVRINATEYPGDKNFFWIEESAIPMPEDK